MSYISEMISMLSDGLAVAFIILLHCSFQTGNEKQNADYRYKIVSQEEVPV